MQNTLWEKYERCAELCSEYLDRFDENVPMELLCFNSFDIIAEVVERALENNTKIEKY